MGVRTCVCVVNGRAVVGRHMSSRTVCAKRRDWVFACDLGHLLGPFLSSWAAKDMLR